MEELINDIKRRSNIPIKPIVAQSEVIEKIKKELLPVFEKTFETTDFAFELPKDFEAFIQRFGGEIANFRGTYGVYIWDWQGVITNTKFWLGDYMNGSKNEAWLCVGEESDKHWYFLCCNPNNPNFGKVADGYDNTPWNQYDMLDLDFVDYLDFVQYASR